ncbi:hypothetical protein FM038_014055 [Shewanella eurypsychrophilus]|uniref:Lipoprotein n=1 Tax=Shewanella eurypsychrophilus TaxID=2593656 RepID=A0ABX6V7X9_9GAMM|nr:MULTISPECIES: hypothetical protein [Shewanella]QFU23158.1 hypothetical protein FS418_15635 [Shewanella sp. YLB-09]QPG58441.1 hypothetical protein FM038_014055 [Shewanella eurypsychrophilus]
MKKIIILAALLALTGCGSTPDYMKNASSNIFNGMNDSQIKKTVSDIASVKLKDPESVQFRNFKIKRGGDYSGASLPDAVRIVCGERNAKNSYGGYTGFKTFYVDGSGFLNDGNNLSLVCK